MATFAEPETYAQQLDAKVCMPTAQIELILLRPAHSGVKDIGDFMWFKRDLSYHKSTLVTYN